MLRIIPMDLFRMNVLSREVEELLNEAIRSSINHITAINPLENEVDHTSTVRDTGVDTTPSESTTAAAAATGTNYQDLLHESIVLYNTNILRYQENMRDITSLLQSIHTSNAYAAHTSRYAQTPLFSRTFTNTSAAGNTHIPSSASSNHVAIAPVYIRFFTNTIRYDVSMNETRCPISLDDFQPNEEILQIRGCGHIFKSEPLRHWFSRNHVCPVCRMNLYEHNGLQTPRRNGRSSTTTRGNVATIPSSTRSWGNVYSGTASLGGNVASLFGNVAATDSSGNYTGLNAYETEAINILLESFILR